MTLRMMKKKNKSVVVAQSQHTNSALVQWDMFVKVVCAHVDPVLASMLYATELVQFDGQQKIVRVATLKKFVLFQDLFIEQKKVYQEYLDRIFGFQTMLLVEFSKITEQKALEPKLLEPKDLDSKSGQERSSGLKMSTSKKFENTVPSSVSIQLILF